MDAIQFVKERNAVQEIKDRLSQINDDTTWGQRANYGLTEDECIAKFFTDQGIDFAPYNIEDVKALLVETPEVVEAPVAEPIVEE